MAAADTAPKARTYGNWRKPQTAGLLGLGSLGTMVMLGVAVIAIILMMVTDLIVALSFAGVGALLLLAVTAKDTHGRSVVARVSTGLGWWSARSQRSHLYRAGPLGHAKWGTYQLPGIAAATTVTEHEDSYRRPFALLHTPASHTYTVVFATEPDGSALVDPEDIDAWVASWGHWLANLGEEPGIAAASVTVETAPDTGTRLRTEVDSNVASSAPTFAREVMQQIVARYPSGSSTVRAYVALTYSSASRAGGKQRSAADLGRELAPRLPALTTSLATTGAGSAHPMSAQDLCEVVRVAYDPAAAPLLEDARANGEVPDLRWSSIGPSAAQTSWGAYRHDSGLSVSWAMTDAPRGNVQSNILTRLLAPHRDIVRKRVTLLFRPIDPGDAAAIVEADRRSAVFNAETKQTAVARDVLSVRAAEATANEEAAGAGLVNFGLIATATVMTEDDLPDAVATLENLSRTARLRLRPAYGAQDSTFAAALPLGLVLQRHMAIPGDLKEKL